MSKSSINYIPEGFGTITPFIMVKDAQRVVEFAQKAFDAEVMQQLDTSDGTLWHACLKIGDSRIMLGDTMGEHADMPICIYVYVKDANAAYQKAVNAGATEFMPPKDQFYGDHSGGVIDPAGNYWFVSTHIEDVKDDELERRARKEEARLKAQHQKKAA